MKEEEVDVHSMSAEDFGDRAATAIQNGHAVILLEMDDDGYFSVLSNFSETEYVLTYLRAAAIQAFMQAGYDFFAPGIKKDEESSDNYRMSLN